MAGTNERMHGTGNLAMSIFRRGFAYTSAPQRGTFVCVHKVYRQYSSRVYFLRQKMKHLSNDVEIENSAALLFLREKNEKVEGMWLSLKRHQV